MSFHFMIVPNLLLILHKKYSFISLCLKPEMWQKVAKFKGGRILSQGTVLKHTAYNGCIVLSLREYELKGKYYGYSVGLSAVAVNEIRGVTCAPPCCARLWSGRRRGRGVYPRGDLHPPQHWRAQGHR